MRRNEARSITVGRDCRLTSEAYSRELVEGLLSTGCDVTDIGVCPTPVFYFSIQQLKKDGGVMLTASHNPPEYNGFKLCLGLDSIHGEDIKTILALIEDENFTEGRGRLSLAAMIPTYIDYVVNNISLPRPLRVGVDAGNGTAGVVA
ncbi:MAG: phosphomannomutase, partial [Desulfobacterales bacterium]